jgi:diketogulonate reductase-like aldo/keto reductase
MTIDGVTVPGFLYGTAWKELDTARLTELALRQGFRGIDTANQRRHYHEAGVGEGLAAAINAGVVTREQVFLQTKYTFPRGQDHRLPYDATVPTGVQVEQSVASSLAHLGVSQLDSLVLHGPMERTGLTGADWEAWRAIEAVRDSGRTRLLGVSNVSLSQLQLLCDQARVRPSFVQNRCYAERGWDRHVRDFCTRHAMIYQGFSLLTANPEAIAHPEVGRIADRYGKTRNQVIFRFALDVGMLPLTGTKSAEHMRQDLEAFALKLDPKEIERIDHIAG